MLKNLFKKMVNFLGFLGWSVLGIWSIMLMVTGNGLFDSLIKFIPFVIWIAGLIYNTHFRKIEKETEDNDKEQA
jgi:hypothetical protein